MTKEEIAAEATKTVAESILARMPSGERTVLFHGVKLRLAVPDTRTGLINARARATVEAATLTTQALKRVVNASKRVRKKDALTDTDLERLDPMAHQEIIQRAALVENAMIVKACADAADAGQLAAFTEEQLFKAVFMAGPTSAAVMAATQLTRIKEVPGVLDPTESPATKGKKSVSSKAGQRRTA